MSELFMLPGQTTTPAPPQRSDNGLSFHLTDIGNAQRFVRQHGKDLRYCSALGEWLIWDKQRFVADVIAQTMELAKDTAKRIHAEALDIPEGKKRDSTYAWAYLSESHARLRAMLALSQSDPEVCLPASAFDADHWILNVANGILDLRTGTLSPHDRAAYCTKLAPVEYHPDATDPVLDSYLSTVTQNDADFASYLQRAVGYSLTGDVTEEKFFIVLGKAATGKTTLLEMMLATLGDYALKANMSTFIDRPSNPGGPRPDLVRLRGARFVAASETASNAKLATAMVKELVGGDTITAREMYVNDMSFKPECKLWLAANEAPQASDNDDGIWRRLEKVPFDATIVPDKKVKQHLTTEGRAAFLAWAVQGCLDWQRDGLGECAKVKESTSALRASMNPLTEFLTTYCIVGDGKIVPTGRLRMEYMEWAKKQSTTKPVASKEWGERLEALGARRGQKRLNGCVTKIWLGIGLLENEAEGQADMAVASESDGQNELRELESDGLPF